MNPRFIIEKTDDQGALSPDGEHAPFAIFDSAAQDWLIVTDDESKIVALMKLLQ